MRLSLSIDIKCGMQSLGVDMYNSPTSANVIDCCLSRAVIGCHWLSLTVMMQSVLSSDIIFQEPNGELKPGRSQRGVFLFNFRINRLKFSPMCTITVWLNQRRYF